MTASDEWLEHLTRERRPPNTIAAARRVMRSLPNASTATREDVEAWWASRAHLSPATRSNDLALLRMFYDFAIIWEHRDDDPTRRIKAPKVPQGLPRPMSRADLNHLLPNLEPDVRRAVALGAYAGLRVSEAAALDWADVDLETRRIRVTGKGGKTRLVGLSPILLDELLPVARYESPRAGGNVVTAGGPPYTPGSLQRKVNRAIKAAGCRRDVPPAPAPVRDGGARRHREPPGGVPGHGALVPGDDGGVCGDFGC